MDLWSDSDTAHDQPYYRHGHAYPGAGYYYYLLLPSPLTEYICHQFDCSLAEVHINLQVQVAHGSISYHALHRDADLRTNKILYILAAGGIDVMTNWYPSLDPESSPIESHCLEQGHWYSIRVDQPHDCGPIQSKRVAISLGFKDPDRHLEYDPYRRQA